MALRYFKVSCKNCMRQFSIKAEEGATVKCNCPFCGAESTIAVPMLTAEKQREKEKETRKQFISEIGKKAIISFLIFATILIIASTLLYVVFTAMSN